MDRLRARLRLLRYEWRNGPWPKGPPGAQGLQVRERGARKREREREKGGGGGGGKPRRWGLLRWSDRFR